jgi:hypothetical protein
MTPYFASDERVQSLSRIVASWLGTPFHAHGRVKGPRGGCSCESLAFSIGLESGWIPSTIAQPRGRLSHWRVHRKSLIVPFIESALSPFLAPLSGRKDELRAGDVIWFTTDNCEHLGTLVNSHEFVHAYIDCGVILSRIDDATYLSHISKAWRPIQP